MHTFFTVRSSDSIPPCLSLPLSLYASPAWIHTHRNGNNRMYCFSLCVGASKPPGLSPIQRTVRLYECSVLQSLIMCLCTFFCARLLCLMYLYFITYHPSSPPFWLPLCHRFFFFYLTPLSLGVVEGECTFCVTKLAFVPMAPALNVDI